VGTVFAILIYYRQTVLEAFRTLLGNHASDSSAATVHPLGRSGLLHIGWLAFIATLPLVPEALFLKKWIDRAVESPHAAAVGFLVTAAVLAATTKLPGGRKGPAQTIWRDALLIGIAQAFAPLPGVSRSGLTIATALARGLAPVWAVQFSLLIAIPAILGATVFELKDLDFHMLNQQPWAKILCATCVAGCVGYLAISFLVRLVRAGKIWWFTGYLVLLALLIFALAGPIAFS
jgi:undecaprenyl-diphosphatase